MTSACCPMMKHPKAADDLHKLPSSQSDSQIYGSYIALSGSQLSSIRADLRLASRSVSSLSCSFADNEILVHASEGEIDKSSSFFPMEERIREAYLPFRQESSEKTSSASSALSSRLTFDSDYFDSSNIDRFGFYLDKSAEDDGKKLLDKYLALEKTQEVERSMKWVRMLKELEEQPPNEWPKSHKKARIKLFDCFGV